MLFQALGGCPPSLACGPLSEFPGSAISSLCDTSFVKSCTSVSDYNWEGFFVLRIQIDLNGLIWIIPALLHFTMFNLITSAKSPLTCATIESQFPGSGRGHFGSGITLPITADHWNTFKLNKRIMFGFVEGISEEW